MDTQDKQSKQSLVHVLEKVSLFKGLDIKQIEKIGKLAQVERFGEEEILFRESEPVKDFYIIASGEVGLFFHLNEDHNKRIGVKGQYEPLAEKSILQENLVHSYSAVVLQKAEVLIFRGEEISILLQKDLSLTAALYKRIALHQSQKNEDASAPHHQQKKLRTEHDLLGEKEVADKNYFGIQTVRALENFNVSGIKLYFYPELIEALASVKLAAAKANHELGLLPSSLVSAIVEACEEIKRGKLHEEFVVDMMQGGAGTSTHMNANEVIANRALELMGHSKGDYQHCHPNNHVNLSQSTNDVYPTALKIALLVNNQKLVKALQELILAMRSKARAFAGVLKMGRTQLQDAVPMTLGQAFEAYAVTLEEEIQRLQQNVSLFLEVNMGGTAIGTGINTDPAYSQKILHHLRQTTGLDLVISDNLVEATQDTGAFVMYSSAVKRLALKLSKISNDLRLLSSGPVAGFNEINLPPMQAGSSIMPGKVNPVIPELVNQIAFKVIGNDLTVTMAAEAGQLELNVMEPVIALSLFESVEMLSNGMHALRKRCIEGITANEKRCRDMVENSIGIVTALNPILGYEVCSQLAKEALKEKISVYKLVLSKNLLTKEVLNEILSPENMIRPRKVSLTHTS